MKLFIFVGILQVLEFKFLKFRNLEILNFHPCNYVSDADISEPHLLEIIFSSLQFPWLCVGVAQQLLNNMDDYLLAGDQVKDMNRITLSHIVSTTKRLI